ncbi:MAG: PH domain-containing protein [Clostridia bacterium]|nr:PH domain-containing protein [Clostridia bacterium]
MEFRAGKGAVWILRVTLVAVNVIVAVLLWLPSCFWPWWPWWSCLFPVVAVLPLWLFYLPKLTRSLRGSFDSYAVRASYGILWRRELFVPVDALRTYEIWTPPLHRLFDCRTVILRFAGGSAWLPLLDRRDAYVLTARLEVAEGSS